MTQLKLILSETNKFVLKPMKTKYLLFLFANIFFSKKKKSKFLQLYEFVRVFVLTKGIFFGFSSCLVLAGASCRVSLLLDWRKKKCNHLFLFKWNFFPIKSINLFKIQNKILKKTKTIKKYKTKGFRREFDMSGGTW